MADPSSPNTHAPSGSIAPISLGSESRAQRQGSSAESAASNVDTTNPFRQGFPSPLRPLPQFRFIVEAEDAEKMVWWEPTRNAVIGYLEARGITWEVVTLINRRNPRRKASQDDLTILISAPHDPSSDSWYLMLQDLQGYLQERGLTQLRVEIIDERYARAPDHFIVEPSHPLVYAWPGIRDRIIGALGPAPWLSLTAIRRGIDKIPEKNPVTILITTPNPLRLRPMLKPISSICANAGFPLQVEVLEESGVFGMDNPSERVLGVGSFANPIPMGSSVSSKSAQDSSGTIGGGILLTKGNLCVRTGVTNFHVLRTKDVPQVFVDNGLHPGQSSDVNIQVVVPSNQDHKYTLGVFQDLLENSIEQPLAMAREKWEMFNNERDAKKIQHLEGRKQARCQQIDTIQAFDRGAGYLWAASGLRVHPQNHFGLDWALVKLPEHRPTPNLLPTDDELLTVGEGLASLPSLTSAKLEEWSSERVPNGEMVFKRGRTTGLTVGKFSYINPAVKLDGKICSAWQVVSLSKKNFCELGDSGSFIIDFNGRWRGLLFASPYTERGDAFVVPIDMLIEDIENLTGGVVSLP